MLEAILFLRWGVVLSSVPKEKLESPPGGRSTLRSNKMTQFWRQPEWHPAHHAPISPLLHNLSLQTETQGLHVTRHWSDAQCKKRKKRKSISEIKHEDAPSYMQPTYSLLHPKYTTQERKEKKKTHEKYQQGPPTL